MKGEVRRGMPRLDSPHQTEFFCRVFPLKVGCFVDLRLKVRWKEGKCFEMDEVDAVRCIRGYKDGRSTQAAFDIFCNSPPNAANFVLGVKQVSFAQLLATKLFC